MSREPNVLRWIGALFVVGTLLAATYIAETTDAPRVQDYQEDAAP